MLVLNRKKGQRVVIGRQVEVTVLEVRGDRVKLGGKAVTVLRGNLVA